MRGISPKGFQTRHAPRETGWRQDRHAAPITVRTRELGDEGFPKDSWWATPDRAEFAKRRADEQKRMQASKFGQISQLSPLPYETERPRPRSHEL